MAQFYGTMEGGRGSATKTGTKKSGLCAHVRGWNIGARVCLMHNKGSGKDEVHIFETSGSHATRHDKLIHVLKES